MAGGVYLFHKVIVKFGRICVGQNGKSTSASGIITPEQIFPLDPSDASMKLCTSLRALIDDPKAISNKATTFKVTLTELECGRFDHDGKPNVRLTIDGTGLDKIVSRLDVNSATFNVRMKNLQRQASNDLCIFHQQDEFELCSPDIVPRRTLLGDSVVLEHTFPKLPSELWNQSLFSDGTTTNLEMVILLSAEIRILRPVTDGAYFVSVYSRDAIQHELQTFMETLLNDKFQTDVVIIAANGTEHPCHKLILARNSPVFRVMLESENFEEGKTKIIKMDDMSGTGVKSLLAYLYHLNVNEAEQDFDIALELLQASEKYSIDRLKAAMMRIIIRKEGNWGGDLDKACRLFCFTSGLEDCTELKNAAVRVLKIHKKDLVKFEEYKNLFKKSPFIAMDLCNALL